ncbi:MAG: EamA family transporter [Actinomycetales bacterium]|nr:EamA family transporter [Actinomycetales bacterium]
MTADAGVGGTGQVPRPALVWTSLAILWVAWGSTYLAIAYMVAEMPLLLAIGLRYLASAVILGAYLTVRRGPRAVLRPAPEVKRGVFEGVLLIGAGNTGVCLAERHVPSGVVAMIVSMLSIWVALLRSRFANRPSATTLVGVAVGFGGVAAIVLSGSHASNITSGGGSVVLWSLAVVLGSLGWACGSFFGPRFSPTRDAVAGAFWQVLAGGALMTILGLLTGERVSDFADASPRAWWSVLYLVIVGSVIAQTAYAWLLSSGTSLSLIATYAYVNPVIAVALGVWFLSEHVTAAALLGGGLVLTAIALVTRGERQG